MVERTNDARETSGSEPQAPRTRQAIVRASSGPPGARLYRLVAADGGVVFSGSPGAFGGHRRGRIYGRLDCPAALRAIERGGYVRERVFFADEATALAAGYRPCARCLPLGYARWRAEQLRPGELRARPSSRALQ